MTQDEIIELARQAGFVEYELDDGTTNAFDKRYEAFAKLVEDKVRQEIIEKNAPVIKKVNDHIKELQDAVKAEREACAMVCGRLADEALVVGDEDAVMCFEEAEELIRARGEA